MRVVRRHTHCKWVLLYIERWLKAPVRMPDSTLVNREKDTLQRAVISPILANLFLHYAFDRWMQDHHPGILFERYAGDVICHCRSEAQAQSLWHALEVRLAVCRLELHPDTTKIVYCKDANRRGDYPQQRLEAAGFTLSRTSLTNWSSRAISGMRRAVPDRGRTQRARQDAPGLLLANLC